MDRKQAWSILASHVEDEFSLRRASLNNFDQCLVKLIAECESIMERTQKTFETNSEHHPNSALVSKDTVAIARMRTAHAYLIELRGASTKLQVKIELAWGAIKEAGTP